MIPGIKYRQYACGCVVPGEAKRLYRKINGKKKVFTVCPVCKDITATYMRAQRKCIDCGKIDAAKKGLCGERCKDCAKKHKDNNRGGAASITEPKTLRYYQAGKQIKKPKKLITEIWCIHRRWCLPNDYRAHLHCGGCPCFEKEDIDMLVYDKRDHDPYEWAYGEAV